MNIMAPSSEEINLGQLIKTPEKLNEIYDKHHLIIW